MSGWEHRAVIDLQGYHLFYLRAKLPEPRSLHTDGQVSHDMFLLKVSCDKDKNGWPGRPSYVDAHPYTELRNKLDKKLKRIASLEFFGTQVGGNVLVWVVPRSPWSSPQIVSIQIAKKSDLGSAIDTVDDRFRSHAISCRIEHASRVTTNRRLLPEFQPKFPHLGEGDRGSWFQCLVIGDTMFHMFLTRTWKHLHDNPALGHARCHPVMGDKFILKVSDDVDCNGRWFYEDIGPESEQLRKELDLFSEQVVGTMSFLGTEREASLSNDYRPCLTVG